MAAKTRSASWVANYLGTSAQTVGRLIEEGKLEAYKLREGGQWHIAVESVEKYLRRCKERYGVENKGDSDNGAAKTR